MIKTAILVIDMINGMEQWIPKKNMLGLLPNIKKVLATAHAKKIPVIYVVHTPLGKKGTESYNEIKKTSFDYLITKKQYSAFFETNLEKLLKKLGVKKLILIGVSTHWCILSTALDASYRGYEITLMQDCIAAPTKKWHNLAIKWMKDTFDIELTTSNSTNKFL